METAVLLYDAAGNLLHSSDDDILYFNYFTQEEWDAGRDTTSGLHYGWIDISEGKDANWQDDPFLRFRVAFAGTHTLDRQFPLLRVTGYFAGTELIPVVMHYVTDAQIMEIVERNDEFATGPTSYSYILSDVDRTGQLDWQLQFDRSAEYPDRELVTVYIDQPEMWDYEDQPLVYREQEYENLAALTEARNLPLQDDSDIQRSGIFRLQELLVFDKWTGADFSNEAYLTTGRYTVDFYLVTAIRSNPLLCAVHGLIYGILYAPSQALLFGLDLEAMLAWIAAGFPFDVVHAVGNLVLGLLIYPLSEVIKKLEKRNG